MSGGSRHVQGDVLDSLQSIAQGQEFVEFHPLGPFDRIDFSSIAAPTHILAGTGDLIVNDERHARPLSRILPNARLTLIEAIGHMLHHSATDALVGAIEDAVSATSSNQ